MNAQLIGNPIIQYGFAGMCVVLLVFLAWLVKRLLAVLEKTTEVIRENTLVIGSLKDESGEMKDLVIEIKDKLNSRPCIARRDP